MTAIDVTVTVTATAGVRVKDGPSEPPAVETRLDRDGLDFAGRSREVEGPAIGANAPVTTEPPAADSVAGRIGHRAVRARGAASSRADELVISATTSGAASRQKAAGPRAPDVTGMIPRLTGLLRVAEVVGGSAQTAAVVVGGTAVPVPEPTVAGTGRAVVGARRTPPGGTRPRGERIVHGVTGRREGTTGRRALNGRTIAATVVPIIAATVRTQPEAEGTPGATIAADVIAVSVIVTGLAARPRRVEGAISSRVPAAPAATGTIGRGDLRTSPAAVGATPTARCGTPVRVAKTAGGEELATGADR